MFASEDLFVQIQENLCTQFTAHCKNYAQVLRFNRISVSQNKNEKENKDSFDEYCNNQQTTKLVLVVNNFVLPVLKYCTIWFSHPHHSDSF